MNVHDVICKLQKANVYFDYHENHKKIYAFRQEYVHYMNRIPQENEKRNEISKSERKRKLAYSIYEYPHKSYCIVVANVVVTFELITVLVKTNLIIRYRSLSIK